MTTAAKLSVDRLVKLLQRDMPDAATEMDISHYVYVRDGKVRESFGAIVWAGERSWIKAQESTAARLRKALRKAYRERTR